MKQKMIPFFLTVLLGVAFSLVFFTGTVQSETITWTLASSPGAAINTWAFAPYPRYQKIVEKATGGRLILKTRVGLFSPKETINGVMVGHADVGFQRLPWVGGTFPLWNFASLPFFFDNVYEYEAALNDPRMIKLMDKTYADVGLVKLMEVPGTAMDCIFAKKPIKTVDDFKGFKVRAGGMLPTFTLQLLGARPMTIAAMELAQALSRGMVDGVQTSSGFGLGVGMTDVTSHVSYWAVQSVLGGCLVVNKKSWDALPNDLQKILLNVSREMQGQIVFSSDCFLRSTKRSLSIAGMKVTVPEKQELERARAMVKPVIDKWLKVAGPHGPEVLAIAEKYASGAKTLLH